MRQLRPSVLAGALLLGGLYPRPLFAGLSAIWANSGEDKVLQDELRANQKLVTTNRVWDGTRVSIFGGKNEVVSFNLILEAAQTPATSVSVSFNTLAGSSGGTITSAAASGNGVFNWTGRPIELFYVRYLQIKGVSAVSYGLYDERHVPTRLQRPWSGEGLGSGGWVNRPGHDRYFPEIAVPLELVPVFSVAAGQNQSIWVDIYIPKSVPSGFYRGNLTVHEAGAADRVIPVELRVYNYTLPDVPNAKTMLYFSSSNLNRRFSGADSIPPASTDGARGKVIRDRLFMLAHRHRISLIGDSGDDCANNIDQPCPEWLPRLDGGLFSSGNGYDGPGVGVGNTLYSIGTFGGWSWKTGTESDMHTHADRWVSWFDRYAPGTEYFLYLSDESTNFAETERWASWILSNPGIGKRLKSFATIGLPEAAAQVPSLDMPSSTITTGIATQWQPLADRYNGDPRKRFSVYNGHRPATGSFATEDDGIALRELAWAQYKKRVQRWFFWESTYYNNYQGGMGQTDVFTSAMTFGTRGAVDASKGETGWNYSNGDGVLFYPGTDRVFPAHSYGVDGLFASLRLKHWRRGIQDVDYLTMANTVAPRTVQALVNSMVPKALWEYGVSDPNDPSWVRTDLGWSTDAERWEAARAQLAAILSGANPDAFGAGGLLGNVRVFPNPWRKDRHAGSPVTFMNIPAGTTVKIFTVSAYLVNTITADGAATWDLKNSAGDPVASGLYVYLISAPNGESKRGKLAVIQ